MAAKGKCAEIRIHAWIEDVSVLWTWNRSTVSRSASERSGETLPSHGAHAEHRPASGTRVQQLEAMKRALQAFKRPNGSGLGARTGKLTYEEWIGILAVIDTAVSNAREEETAEEERRLDRDA